MIEIYNESCFDTLANVPIGQFNVVLTSPFYNTNQKAGKTRTLMNCKPKHYDYVRYDEFVDNMENEEYYDFTVRLFDEFDRVLNKCGVVLYNISYGAENTNCMIETINAIVTRTNFSMADIIGWKKKAAVPNNVSPNRLTRIFEFVFVFCRKDEINEFYMNKKQVSVRASGQKVYENIFNYVEASNNDGACPYNKATYSSELCEKLLKLYCPAGGWVYDPFMGSGTTAVACKKLNLNCIGSEISSRQVEWAKNRVNNTPYQTSLFEQIEAVNNEVGQFV